MDGGRGSKTQPPGPGSTCQVSSARVPPLGLSFLICKEMGQDHMPGRPTSSDKTQRTRAVCRQRLRDGVRGTPRDEELCLGLQWHSHQQTRATLKITSG